MRPGQEVVSAIQEVKVTVHTSDGPEGSEEVSEDTCDKPLTGMTLTMTPSVT